MTERHCLVAELKIIIIIIIIIIINMFKTAFSFLFYLSRFIRKHFAYAKTKMQISFAVTSAPLVFATRIVRPLFFLNPKFQASSHLLWLYSLVCVSPGRKQERWFSHDAAHLIRHSSGQHYINARLVLSRSKIVRATLFAFLSKKPYQANQIVVGIHFAHKWPISG